MPEVSLNDWREFTERVPNAHLLQMGEWGELKASFGWKAARLVVGSVGCQVLFRRLPLGLSFGYVPKGPIGAPGIGQNSQQLWREVDATCSAHRAIFAKIEPDSWEDGTAIGSSNEIMDALGDWGLRASPHSIQPRRSVIVDLHGNEGDILARMKPKCRYNIGLATRKGIKVRQSDDLQTFQRMMEVTAKRDGFAVHSLEYIRRAYDLFHPSGTAALFIAEYEKQPVAGLMVFRRGRRAWYLYGASSDEARELMPNYLLQWEAMRWARMNACVEYDLWGAPDEDERTLEAGFQRRSDGLWGVYRFKRGFGGQLVRAAQARDRVYQPLLYSVYRRRLGSQSLA